MWDFNFRCLIRGKGEVMNHNLQKMNQVPDYEPFARSQSTRNYIEDMLKELRDLASSAEIDDLTELLKMTSIAIETKGRLGLIFPEA